MTKKWYSIMQKQDYYMPLKIDKNTNKFSDDYFKKLYEKEKKEKSNHMHFGGEGTYKNFEHYYEDSLCRVKGISKSILNDVSDIRVLALGYVTKDIYDRIKKYCIENSHYVEQKMDEYLKDYKKQFGNNYPKFMENWILHDCDVVSSNFVKNDIILKIDNSGGYTIINEIRFKNAKVIKQDKDLKNLCWLYDEIYKKGDNYEIHVLFGSYNDAKTYDFIIECSDIECKLEKG